MNRRQFLRTSLSAATVCALNGAAVGVSFAAAPAGADYRRLLVLIELKGGNDGLNTLVPFADPAYYALRPKLAIARDAIVPLSDRAGLHPSLAPLLPLWNARELAVLQGVGYPAPNLSHFRSIEIWDTASRSEEYLQEGWLTRTFATAPTPATFAADGVIIGTADLGPLTGGGTRAIALANPDQFLRQARLATPEGAASNRALAHILKVEADIVQAAAHLGARRTLATEFPTRRVRQRDPHGGRGDRRAVGRRRGPHHAVRVRYAYGTGRDAGAALGRARRGNRRTQGGAHRARALERHAGADLRRNSAGGRRRISRTAPTTARPACISRSAAGSRAACTESSLRSRASAAMATWDSRSIFAASTRRCWSAGGVFRPRRRSAGNFRRFRC